MDHSSCFRSHGSATFVTDLCAIVCLDGAQKFTLAQEQQLVRSDPRDRSMCQHKQKQVRSSEVTCLIPVLRKSTQSLSEFIGVVPDSEHQVAASTQR